MKYLPILVMLLSLLVLGHARQVKTNADAAIKAAAKKKAPRIVGWVKMDPITKQLYYERSNDLCTHQ